MSMISKWIMGVVGAAVLCLLVDLIMPEGSTKKHIRSIMAIITLFIILSPLPSLLNQNWEIDNIFGSNNIKPDNRIVDNVHTQQITLLEESLENKLSEDGYNDSKVIISAYSKENVIKIKAVSVDLSLCGVTASDYEKVKQKVQIYLDDNNILVVVYG
ncbi:MAG TPA: hypothetical protein GX745_02465 [Clostridiales bacterium]|nr:hypothetical protein [Clostridiales bacterium]